MVFSSLYFLVYFLPLFLLLYTIFPKSWKNTFLLIASIIFYSWGGPKFVFVILATTFVDFFVVQKMDATHTPKSRRALLILSLCINLSLLFYFKYFNFFAENFAELFKVFGGDGYKVAKIVLPIGISFYTFESLTYVIDVYRRVHKPLKNVWDYQLYILLFPKLIAGPIVRYHEISDQIKGHLENETAENRLSGFIRFCIGLGKKVLIANVMAAQADAIFNLDPATLDTATAWTGALAYTFQIYFDFSGYSDMAIGLCQIMGFRIPENFNNPYTSGSITEFWRRWHMTLGSWMRNYLYIPLGGNRVNSKARLLFNLWIVFLLSGLWHGAAWTFVFWGAYHGLFLIIERGFLLKLLQKLPRWAAAVYAFPVVIVGWVFFRSEKLQDAFIMVKRMFAFDFSTKTAFTNNNYDVMVWVAVFFAFITFVKQGQQLHDVVFQKIQKQWQYVALIVIAAALFILSLGSITGSDFNPFIYFRF